MPQTSTAVLGSPVCLLSRHACRFLRVHVLSCDAFQNGFVPNYSAAGAKSQDRSEEIIGSKVLLSLYKQYKEKWIVSLLFVSRTNIAGIWVAFCSRCQRYRC